MQVFAIYKTIFNYIIIIKNSINYKSIIKYKILIIEKVFAKIIINFIAKKLQKNLLNKAKILNLFYY